MFEHDKMYASICFKVIKSKHTYIGNFEKNLPIYVKSVCNRLTTHTDMNIYQYC